MSDLKQNKRIKIIELEGNNISKKFEINSEPDFSSVNEEKKK